MNTRTLCPACGRPFLTNKKDDGKLVLSCANPRCPSWEAANEQVVADHNAIEEAASAFRKRLEATADWIDV